LATFVAAAPEQVVFLGNATDGINAVLRSLDFKPGDEVVIPDLAYNAVTMAARYIADHTGAKLVVPTIPVPLPDADSAVAAFAAALTARTKLVIVDHIVSPMGYVLPIKRIADAAHAVGARVLIDGAHAPGHIPLAMAKTGADWYVGNCHKWLFAPRACGFLWAADPAQEIHPLANSHGYRSGLAAEFDWTGTRDPAAFLSIPAAIAFHAHLGGSALMTRNAALVQEAADIIGNALGTARSAPPEMFASMATVGLPPRLSGADGAAVNLRRRIADEHRIETIITAHRGAFWVRLAAQAYNARADYERLAEVLRSL
jgi:isopenicillin-N epimerase